MKSVLTYFDMSFGLGYFWASAGADEIHCVDRGKCWLPSSTWVYDWLPSGDQTWQWKILCLCDFPLPRFITRGYYIHNWTLTSQIREIRFQPASKPDSVDLRRHFLVNEIRRNRSNPGGLGGLGDQKETKMWNTPSCHLMSTMFNLNKYIKQYQTYHYNSAFFFGASAPSHPSVQFGGTQPSRNCCCPSVRSLAPSCRNLLGWTPTVPWDDLESDMTTEMGSLFFWIILIFDHSLFFWISLIFDHSLFFFELSWSLIILCFFWIILIYLDLFWLILGNDGEL